MLISPTTASADQNHTQTIVSRVAKNGSKGYLEVDGKPYTMMGVQSFGEWQTYGSDADPIPTNQDKRVLSQDWLENTFEKVKAAGFHTIQIELAWNQIQPDAQGRYDWTLLDKYVQWAKQYDLKMDFVWFGTNGCGGGILPETKHGFMTSIPAYLQGAQYWGREENNGEQRAPYLPIKGGKHYNDAQYLFDQEQQAVHAMFNHLAQVDKTHQTILFQVHNEPNHNDEWFSQHEVWAGITENLGKAVKTSDYVVATRLNFMGWSVPQQDATTFKNSENIDFQGPDVYTDSISNLVNAVKETAGRSRIAYIPETYSGGSSLSSKAAAILAAGGFVDFWQLNESWAGPRYAFYGAPNDGYTVYTDWKLGEMPKIPESAQRMTNFNKSIGKMQGLTAIALPQSMATFNTKDMPAQQSDETKTIGGKSIRFFTADKAVGLAVKDETSGAYYLASDTQGSSTYNLGAGVKASVGSFDADGAWHGVDRTVADNGDIVINSGELIRVVDTAALGGAIESVRYLKESDYTPESWKTFSPIRDKAESMFGDANASQSEIDAAASALIAARKALVIIGELRVTDPCSLTQVAGTTLESIKAAAPNTVAAHAGTSKPEAVPVVWDWKDLEDAAFAKPGVVTVSGTATTPQGVQLETTLTVFITAAEPENVVKGHTEFVQVTGQQTEYGKGNLWKNLVNGNVSDEAWVTWKSNGYTPDPSATITLPASREVGQAKLYYHDGRVPVSVRAEYRDDQGNWHPFGNTVSFKDHADAVVTFDSPSPVKTQSIRFINTVENQADANFISVSEIEVFAAPQSGGTPVPAADASLGDLRIDGQRIGGFDPLTTAYRGVLAGDATQYPLVQAYARDDNATVAIEQPDASNHGKATISVTAADGSTAMTTTVDFGALPALSGMEITAPTKTAYTLGERLDTSGLQVTAVWKADGVVTLRQPVALDDPELKIDGFDSSSIGKRTVTLTYRGLSASFEVSVAQAAEQPTPSQPGGGSDAGPNGPAGSGSTNNGGAQTRDSLSATGAGINVVMIVAGLMAVAGVAIGVGKACRRRV
jgi:hypothetical protein